MGLGLVFFGASWWGRGGALGGGCAAHAWLALLMIGGK